MTSRVPGTAGYGESAPALVRQYESLAFADVHRDLLPLLPAAPARALDVGAGTGRDAAALAARGYRVTAVEPTPELRQEAQRLHPEAAIRWLDDALPGLAAVRALGERFDIVLLSAVWMHLDVEERRTAMTAVAELLAPGGVMSLSLRHGPVPDGRRMFEVTAAETRALAEGHGLATLHNSKGAALLNGPDVWWSRLVFGAPARPAS
jgi:SAM-dependent methyltransferase